MEYREILYNEIEEVAKLHNRLLYFIQDVTKDDYFSFDQLDETVTSRNLEAFIESSVRKIFIAKDNDIITGFIACEIIDCFLPVSRVKKVGYISCAYVSPEFRRKGIMKRLENLALDYFKSNGLEYAELNIITNNTLAQRNWESLGYKTFREQMRKKL